MNKLVKFTIVILFLFIFCLTGYSIFKTATTFQPDFSIFYFSAKDVAQGIPPYTDHHLFTAFNYPLVTTIFFIPFTYIPFVYSQILFTFLSLLSLFMSISVAFHLLNKKINIYGYLLTMSLVLLMFPVKFTFGMGQINIVAYLFLLIGFLLYKKNSFKSSLLFLVLAVLFKPILGFTFFVFLFEKKWKYFFSIIFIILSAVLLAPILLNQPHANLIFLQNIFSQHVSGREVYYNQGLLGFISRITPDLTLRTILNMIGTVGLVIIASIKIRNSALEQKLSLLLTLLLLIDPLSWQHHFVFLLLPFLVVLGVIQKATQHKTFMYIILTLAYMLAAWNFKTPQTFNMFPFSLLLSNQFYAALLLFGLQVKLL